MKPLRYLFIATRNAHKMEEIRGLLGADFAYFTLRDLPGAPEVIEDAPTFAGNATKKALSLARWLVAAAADSFGGARTCSPQERARLEGLGVFNTTGPAKAPADSSPRSPPNECAADALVLADDSGLEVDALGGAPGVHSARFAALDHGRAGNSADADNNAKLLRLLADVADEKRTARFRCVIVVASPTTPEAAPAIFEGVCEGRLQRAPTGGGGFGYDPLFVPVGHTRSFAELGEAVKNTLSHRARALAQMGRWLEGQTVSAEWK